MVLLLASEHSGLLITARLAAEQGWEVFALPGHIRSNMSKSTHRLINEGASLIHSIEDLLNQLPQVSNVRPNITDIPITSNTGEPIEIDRPEFANDNQKIGETIQKLAPVVEIAPDTKEEKTVISVIGADKTHIDKIVRDTNLPVHKVSGILTMLEIDGIIEQLPGKFYRNLNQ